MATQTRTQRVKKAAKSNPYVELTEAVDIANDADRYHAIKVVMDQEGGKILLEQYIRSVVAGVEQLAQYETLSHERLISLCAFITANLQSARTLCRAAENLELADEALEEALRT